MITRKMRVDDMNCNGCAARVVTTLMNLKGVVKVITNLDDQEAEVTYDDHALAEPDLREALRTAGFGMPNRDFCENTQKQ
ncbi:MAG: heavy-metal-associated domain-containing protein [Planctomycetes bacterium]|nr:heavy-metal-associated domain-containing protein [Planctomycetota bacterium]